MASTLTIIGLVYLVVGAACAWRWIDYSERAFWIRNLPKGWPNRMLTSIVVGLLVTWFWPLYWRLRMSHNRPSNREKIDGQETTSRPPDERRLL